MICSQKLCEMKLEISREWNPVIVWKHFLEFSVVQHSSIHHSGFHQVGETRLKTGRNPSCDLSTFFDAVVPISGKHFSTITVKSCGFKSNS